MKRWLQQKRAAQRRQRNRGRFRKYGDPDSERDTLKFDKTLHQKKARANMSLGAGVSRGRIGPPEDPWLDAKFPERKKIRYDGDPWLAVRQRESELAVAPEPEQKLLLAENPFQRTVIYYCYQYAYVFHINVKERYVSMSMKYSTPTVARERWLRKHTIWKKTVSFDSLIKEGEKENDAAVHPVPQQISFM